MHMANLLLAERVEPVVYSGMARLDFGRRLGYRLPDV
jgi:hypothetical protein